MGVFVFEEPIELEKTLSYWRKFELCICDAEICLDLIEHEEYQCGTSIQKSLLEGSRTETQYE